MKSVTLTRDDVARSYHLFLRREPESDAVVNDKLQHHENWWSLASDMLTSEEFALRMRIEHGQASLLVNPKCYININSSADQLAQLYDHVRETWAELGRSSPHHSVLTGPNFLPERMTPQREVEFYATGAAWADEFTNALVRNGITVPQGLVVDFGCGLGRVGEHLSTLFDRYLGVDISPSHLEIARSRLEHLGRTNSQFQLLPDFLEADSRIDAIYCVLVLQHNPPPIMLSILNQLLSRLNPGGVGFIQIPTIIYDYSFEIGDYLAGLDKPKQMEMHALPQKEIFASIKGNQCDLIEMYDDQCAGPLGQSYRFLVRKTG